jgi:MORN repeat protein
MSESTGTPRRGRFRFLYQFSLRTLLLVTAAVAIFCNWYFQPKYHEEELAGKDLRVRRQMKTPVVVEESPPMLPGEPVNHGHYTLLDGEDFVLARGQFADGEESGHWVTYYPTGHKAAEGKMLHGVKGGLWRTWYEDGTPASEVTYADKPVEQEQTFRDYWDWRGPGGASGIHPDKVVDPHVFCFSSREGPAKAWHHSGQLKFEGTYKADLQHGAWTFYDDQGRVTAKGPFRNGKRHGAWTLTRSVSEGSDGDTHSVHYIDGRSEDQLAQLTARLEEQLDSPRTYRRQQALIDLAEIGEGAVSVLARRLATSDQHEQAALLAVLPRMNHAAAPLLPRVRELTRSGDATTAHQARLTLFQLEAGSRAALYDGLVAEAVSAASAAQCLRELVILYRSDPDCQEALFAELMSLPLRRTDVNDEQLNAAVRALGGNIGPHILAAIGVPNRFVRLQGAKALLAVFRVSLPARTYVSFDKQQWESLLETLKNDPSLEIRAMVEEIEQGPQFYGGVGGFNGQLGGFGGTSSGGFF